MSNAVAVGKICPGCNSNPPRSPRATYCDSCIETRNTGPRVRTKLHTSIRIMKGVKLNLNLPLFKL